jgi:hypothetical protein
MRPFPLLSGPESEYRLPVYHNKATVEWMGVAGLCLVPFMLFLEGIIGRAGNAPNDWATAAQEGPYIRASVYIEHSEERESGFFAPKSMALFERGGP